MAGLDAFKLTGKNALVTGAARGIGQALAIGLAEAGADVLLIDRLSCAETAQEIENLGRNAVWDIIDLTELNEERASNIISLAVDRLGGLDILVNNAGIISRTPTIDFTEDQWSTVLDLNLNTVYYLSQATARHFIDRSKPGKIINLGSVLSFQGGWQVPSYTASKSGVVGLTKALSNEWAKLGINVNAIAPGYFKTAVTAGIRSDPDRSRTMLNRIPAGRWGELNDLKGPVVFLASEASDYLHGSVMSIDGGWLSR